MIASTLNRRRFLQGMAAASLCPVACRDSDSSQDSWIAAQGQSLERYSLAVGGDDGRVQSNILSGFRGHGAACDPTAPERVALFGRRPGRGGMVVDVVRKRIEQRWACAPGRNLQGHGCFSLDGAWLLTAEADNQTGAGRVGVRDARTLELVDELDTHGVGPHEMVPMPDGRTLAVANGGILTRPETGRKKLNLDTMRSTLVYLDLVTGECVAEHAVPETKASIRHLAVVDAKTVVFAMQVQREAAAHDAVVSLAAVHRRGEEPRLLNDRIEYMGAMRDYVGSVAVSPRSRLAGFTSPKGNIATFWEVDTGAFAGFHALRDVCGLAASSDGQRFILSSSGGHVRIIDASNLQETQNARILFSNIAWDNHLTVLPSKVLA